MSALMHNFQLVGMIFLLANITEVNYEALSILMGIPGQHIMASIYTNRSSAEFVFESCANLLLKALKD